MASYRKEALGLRVPRLLTDYGAGIKRSNRHCASLLIVSSDDFLWGSVPTAMSCLRDCTPLYIAAAYSSGSGRSEA